MEKRREKLEVSGCRRVNRSEMAGREAIISESPPSTAKLRNFQLFKNKPSDRNIAPINLQLPAGVALVQLRGRIEYHSSLAFVVKGN